jgi:8-oxo-dGTP pyrophosphatase MutT (NUDIX family)
LSSMNKAGDSSKRELDQEIMSAWREAAEELGIRVEIPFILVAEDGETERYGGRVIDFGGPNGTVFGTFDDEVSSKRRQDAGYYCSRLASSYRAYNRELFIATLDDWKWFGPRGQEPTWYSGKDWSQPEVP